MTITVLPKYRPSRKAVDIAVGIALPLLLLAADPTVFRSTIGFGPALLGAFKADVENRKRVLSD